LEPLVDAFEAAMTALDLSDDGDGRAENTDQLMERLERVLNEIRTLLLIGGTLTQVECCHRLFRACGRAIPGEIAIPGVCALFALCFKAAVRLGSAEALQGLVRDWSMCWIRQAPPFAWGTEFMPPLFAIFEGGWGSLPLEMRAWLFGEIATQKVFRVESFEQGQEPVPAGELDPPDAICALTFLCRVMQSLGTADQETAALFQSLFEVAAVVKEPFICAVLKAELEMTLMVAGLRPPEEEFDGWLRGVVEANVIISNYHRALLLRVLELVAGSYPNIGAIAELQQHLLTGVLAGEEQVAALRRTEGAEVFDRYSSPVSETEISGFVTLELWD
jgi:hypothetical protein